MFFYNHLYKDDYIYYYNQILVIISALSKFDFFFLISISFGYIFFFFLAFISFISLFSFFGWPIFHISILVFLILILFIYLFFLGQPIFLKYIFIIFSSFLRGLKLILNFNVVFRLNIIKFRVSLILNL